MRCHSTVASMLVPGMGAWAPSSMFVVIFDVDPGNLIVLKIVLRSPP